jgi:ribosomal protein S18 acetylase RimI-like enzyme
VRIGGEIGMETNLRVCNFSMKEHGKQVYKLFQAVSGKYENTIYWYPSDEGNTWICFDGEELVGKGQAMLFRERTQADASDAKHSIYINIKVHPDGETDYRIYDLLYEAVYEKAKSIKNGLLANRQTKLCVGNFAEETNNNEYFINRGFKKAEDQYWMKMRLEDKVSYQCELDSILTIEKWSLETPEAEQEFLKLEYENFGDESCSLKSLKRWKENDGFEVIAAFYLNHPIGCIVLYKEDETTGMVEDLFVNESWRNKGIAKKLLVEGLTRFENMGLKHAILLVTTDNFNALSIYKQLGFEIEKEEKRFYIDLV